MPLNLAEEIAELRIYEVGLEIMAFICVRLRGG